MSDWPETDRNPQWRERLDHRLALARRPVPLVVEGRLTRMVGLALEATGCSVAMGGRCLVQGESAQIEAEVVGFADDRIFLMPTGDPRGLVAGASVRPMQRVYEAEVGPGLLGRVIDGAGHPLDGLGPLRALERRPLQGVPQNPLLRRPVRSPLDVGVRVINGLFTVGRGQRLGLFAGSGVGKSVLLGMMTRYTEAEIIVVGLIGERGREVVEFVQEILGPEGLSRAVVVAAPADTSPLMRLHGAWQATAIAEYFRDQGRDVLLLMDSLTRVAQAQREISLAIGEPPATKGYPPSVFARLPQLVERAGNAAGQGSITAFYTVLAEGDDQQDPIADAARAILDGHIVLSRENAEAGIYPAIDLEASISRVMQSVVPPEQWHAAQRFRRLWSTWRQNRDLINIGAYKAGSDPRIDQAVERQPQLLAYLRQDMTQSEGMAASVQRLLGLLPKEAATGQAPRVQ